MANLDHVILKVNDLQASVAFYRDVLGFALEGTDGPFTVLRAGPDFLSSMRPAKLHSRYSLRAAVYVIPSLHMVVAITSSAYGHGYGQRRSQEILLRILAAAR